VVGLAWSNDPEISAGSSSATSMAFHTRQVIGDDPDKKGYPGPPGWGLGVRLTTSPPKKIYLLRCPSHSSVQVLLIEKPHPSLKGPRTGLSLP